MTAPRSAREGGGSVTHYPPQAEGGGPPERFVEINPDPGFYWLPQYPPPAASCCFFGEGREPGPGEALCRNCREAVSGFLEWLGRQPLPERAP